MLHQGLRGRNLVNRLDEGHARRRAMCRRGELAKGFGGRGAGVRGQPPWRQREQRQLEGDAKRSHEAGLAAACRAMQEYARREWGRALDVSG